MKIKTKLRLGFGFLFLIVIIFGIVSLSYLNKISQNSKVILKNNYESLSFSIDMRSLLDEHKLPLSAETAAAFEKKLLQEEHNLTEPGEQEAVQNLRKAFLNMMQNDQEKEEALRLARLSLKQIDQVNMQAIVRKYSTAQKSVDQATLYLALTASICFLVLFTFIVNFPGFIANPISALLEGIREISKKNYHRRLEFKGNDEFSELASAFNEMVHRLNEWENSNLAKIKSEKLRIEAIIEQMQDAIIGLNEKKEILFINPIAHRLMNLNEQNIVGQNAVELSAKNDLFKKILESTTDHIPLKIYADGKESYFQLENREITVPNFDIHEDQELINAGISAGKVYILKNITQFKELDEAKTNFIATVSHELKTPISSIKMSLTLLSDQRVGTLNTEQQELITHIQEDSNRLLKMTSELLDLSQAETGNLQLNFLPTPPNDIVQYAVNAVKLQAEQKNIYLELILKQNLPKVYADVEKTAWVLVNFLSNALRYSPEKSRIVVQVIEVGTVIEFSVRDFGKGIDERYQKRLFERYFQVPTDGKNKSGTGLGLAISKDFIEAENGRIWVESSIGEGSRFCFSLPIMD